ncbi:MAG: NAD-dependent epimerase/dehydratase family protein, partial [Chloroflexi bacterium]|nr:NAD-dependent epimerase/dehydratase family protein [Chloroflexota bacterium]
MDDLPEIITTTEQLEELLSRPTKALLTLMRNLPGDLMILGAGGKIGPTLARMAQRAVNASGVARRVIAVARGPLPELAAEGIETVPCDLLDLEGFTRLPLAENVVFLAGRKFGSTGNEPLTWMTNVIVPYHVASVFREARIVAFSTGCVYPLVHVMTGGSVESDAPAPVGE